MFTMPGIPKRSHWEIPQIRILQGRHKVAPRRLPELRGVLLLLAGRLDVRRVAADLLRQASEAIMGRSWEDHEIPGLVNIEKT